MKTIFISITILFFTSCKSGDNDVKINTDTGDTLKVTKRYPSTKILEIIKYKDNKPNSNYAFSEKGDSIKVPKVIHLVDHKSLYLFIPRVKQFTKIAVLFASQDSTITEPLYTEDGIVNSTEFTISPIMVDKNKIKGFIKCESIKGDLTYYPFQIGL